MKISHQALVSAMLLGAVLLTGCGGGGGSTTSSAPAAAPASNTSTSNQLADSIAISGYSSLSVAQLTSSGATSTTRTAFQRVFQNLASFFVKSSVAQSSSSSSDCSNSSDIMKLVGIGSDGSVNPIQVTLGSDACGIGFLDMFDAKNYILLVGEGIYKDDLTCNLVFVKKSDGQMFCVGETQSARYKIKGSKNWSNYAVLQVSDDGNFMFLEATAQIYKNNALTGEVTKLLRFDLRDLDAGPKATTVYEGFNTSWMSGMYGGSSNTEYEGFFIQGYVGLDNGNLAIQYYRYVNASSSWISLYRAQYVSFDSAGNPTRSNIDFSSGFSGINSSNSWINVSCWMKTTANPSKAYLVTNANYSYNGMTGTGYSIYSVDTPPSGSTSAIPELVVRDTSLCQNSYAANTLARRGNTYFSVTNTYSYFGGSFGGSSIAVISNDLTGAADQRLTVSFNPTGWGWNNYKVTTSKDYLYVTLPQSSWNWWDNSGDTVIQVTPGSGAVQTAVQASDSYLITSVSTSMLDNIVKVSGRIKTSDDLTKFVGTITGNTTPSFTVDTTASTGYKPVTIVKL